MSKVIGRLGSIGIGVEATAGTAVAPDYWIPVRSIDMDDKVDFFDNDSGMGRIEELNDSDTDKLYASGSYEGKIFLDSVGAELTALFGAAPTSTQRSTSGVYDHVFAVANNNSHKSLTIGYKDGLQDVRFPYGMIDTWKFEASLGDYIKRTVGLMSKKSATASNTVAITDEVEFIPSMISFYQATDQSGLDAASAIKITNFKFDVKKNVEAAYVLGTNEPDTLNNKQFSLEGSFEAYFESTTQRDLVFANTNKAMRIDMLDTTTDLGSTHNPQLYFDFYKVQLSEFTRGWNTNDLLTQTIKFKALLSVADTALLAARLTNTVTSY